MFHAEGRRFPVPDGTYIDEVSGVKHIRDLIAKQILFSSSKTLDVDMLDDNLDKKGII